MADFASYTCPICGERILGEAVVDPTFVPRMDAHKASHATILRDRYDRITLGPSEDEDSLGMTELRLSKGGDSQVILLSPADLGLLVQAVGYHECPVCLAVEAAS